MGIVFVDRELYRSLVLNYGDGRVGPWGLCYHGIGD